MSTEFTYESSDELLKDLATIYTVQADAEERLENEGAREQKFGPLNPSTQLVDPINVRATRHFMMALDFIGSHQWDDWGRLFPIRDTCTVIDMQVSKWNALLYQAEAKTHVGEAAIARVRWLREKLNAITRLDDVDGVEHEMRIDEIAAVANMSVPSVRNATSKAGRDGLKTFRNEHGHVVATSKDVREWLCGKSRQSYRPAVYESSVELGLEASRIDLDRFGRLIGERLDELGVGARQLRNIPGGSPLDEAGYGLVQAGKPLEFDLQRWVQVANVLQMDAPLVVCTALHAIANVNRERNWWRVGDFAWGARLLFASEGEVKRFRVPVAGDGSIFHPGLRRTKGYQIGQRHGTGLTTQRYEETFEQALEGLQQMPTPYWRRPSPISGVYGTVKGQAWREMTMDELKALSG